MSMYCNDPLWIPSPWPDDVSDEMANILSNTFHALAMACEDRYVKQLQSYHDTRRAALYDPDRPWIRKPVEPDHDGYRADQEACAANFKARQLDLFDSSAGWEDVLWEHDDL
jgi:hypothetical protein